MAIGIVSDDDLKAELNNLSIPSDRLNGIIKDIKVGRGPNPNVPTELKKVIGETSVTEGRAAGRELAAEFGLSKQTADAYKNGATSLATYNQPSPLTDHINSAKQKVSKRARNKLMAALRHITEDKLGETDAKDLSGIAKNMAGIVKDMEPAETTDKNNVQFVFFTPPMKEEKSYVTIDAPE